MNKKSNVWKMLLVVLLVVSFAGCRRGEEQEEEPASEEVQLEQNVNKFLEENEVTISTEGARANLADVSGGDAAGVATKEQEENSADFTVLAALPDLDGGSYQAWVAVGEGEYTNLGSMRAAKGGYLIERSMDGDFSEANVVEVSKETLVGSQPTSVILKGEF